MPIPFLKIKDNALLILSCLLISSILLAEVIPNGMYIFWLLFLGINLVISSFFKSKKEGSYGLFDLVLATLLIYGVVHYYFFSSFNFQLIYFWVYVGFIGCFYFFKNTLQQTDLREKRIRALFTCIKIVCILEALIAYLQYFEVLASQNMFFKLIGTFRSPNTLAAFLSIGIVLCLWTIIFSEAKSKKQLYLNIAILFFLTGVVLLSKARASWLAILVAFILLSFTSEKVKSYLGRFSKIKKIVFSGLIISIITVGIITAYQLKPESVNGRGFIAELTIKEIQNKPLFGHGLFSFTSEFNQLKSTYFLEKQRSWEEIKVGGFAYSTFNDFLNIIFEIGLVGFLLILLMIGIAIKQHQFTNQSRIAFAVFSMFGIYALFSYPIKVPHLMTVGILVLAILKTQSKRKALSSSIFFGYVLRTLVFCLGSMLLYTSRSTITAQKKLQTYQKGSIKNLNKKELIKLYQGQNDIGYPNFYLGLDLIHKGHEKEGVQFMEKGFKELPLPEFSERLTDFYLKEKKYKKAEEFINYSIGNEPFKFKPRMQLAELQEELGAISQMKQTLTQIVKLPIKIPSEQVTVYKTTATELLNDYQDYKPYSNSIVGNISGNKTIFSNQFNRDINYRVYLPNSKYIEKLIPVVYIVDGQQYLEETKIISQTDKLIKQRKIQPIALVFIDSRNTEDLSINHRHEYLICNFKFANFFTQELLPECERMYPIHSDPSQRTILGHSLGGLFAAYLGDTNPDVFKNIAMQSPWFEACPVIYDEYEKKNLRDLKIYMSFGTGKDTKEQDMPMLKTLFKKGYQIKINEVTNADHTWKLWSGEIEKILEYFYGLKS